MVYDCGSFMAKYVLCIFNFIIFLAGSTVLAIGIWLAVDKNSFIGLSKIVPSDQLQNFTKPGVIEQVSYILIAIGALMFLVSFLGYCGALRESQCMLTTYGILLLIILVLEITVGCLTIIYKARAEEETKNILKSTLAKYSQTEEGDAITVAWNSLQTGLHCCGVDNYTDYQKNVEWAKGDKIVPESCCVLDEATSLPLAPTCTSSPNDVNSYYMQGCYKALITWIMTNLNIIIGIAVGFGIVEILGIFLSFCLAKSINGYRK